MKKILPIIIVTIIIIISFIVLAINNTTTSIIDRQLTNQFYSLYRVVGDKEYPVISYTFEEKNIFYFLSIERLSGIEEIEDFRSFDFSQYNLFIEKVEKKVNMFPIIVDTTIYPRGVFIKKNESSEDVGSEFLGFEKKLVFD